MVVAGFENQFNRSARRLVTLIQDFAIDVKWNDMVGIAADEQNRNFALRQWAEGVDRTVFVFFRFLFRQMIGIQNALPISLAAFSWYEPARPGSEIQNRVVDIDGCNAVRIGNRPVHRGDSAAGHAQQNRFFAQSFVDQILVKRVPLRYVFRRSDQIGAADPGNVPAQFEHGDFRLRFMPKKDGAKHPRGSFRRFFRTDDSARSGAEWRINGKLVIVETVPLTFIAGKRIVLVRQSRADNGRQNNQ